MSLNKLEDQPCTLCDGKKYIFPWDEKCPCGCHAHNKKKVFKKGGQA